MDAARTALQLSLAPASHPRSKTIAAFLDAIFDLDLMRDAQS